MNKVDERQSEVYRFANCSVDADRRELKVAGESVTMQPKAFELLLYLIRNRQRAVDKDELQDALWPRSIVTETALTRCVMKARRAVGDDADTQAVIKTVHGHGYRFTAEIKPADTIEDAAAVTDANLPARRRPAFSRPAVIAAAFGLLAISVVAWMVLLPEAAGGQIRVAVLPMENATDDTELDWVSTGLMALMNRMLEDDGVETVDSRNVMALTGDQSTPELLATGSSFRSKLAATTAATHVVGTNLQRIDDLYRLTYAIAADSRRPERRTIVGAEPTLLIRELVDTLTALLSNDTVSGENDKWLSNDTFLNEAYARAMALYFEGRYQEAKSLFEVIIEQEPHLFWPRYERALAIRNLRDFDTAERELIALRIEIAGETRLKEQANVENALGILYMQRQRNTEARDAFEKTVALALEVEDSRRAGAALQNLGLLERNVGNLPEAVDYMSRAESAYKELDLGVLPGSLYNNMAGVLMQMGRFEDAEQKALQAIASFRLSGRRLHESYALNRLSDIYTHQRHYDEALEAAERSLSVRVELDDSHGIGSSNVTLADIAFYRGDLTRSLQYAKQAYELGVDIDSVQIVVAALKRIARAEMKLGNPYEAVAQFTAADAIARDSEDRINVFLSQLGIASAWIEIGDYDAALAIATELLDDSRQNDRRREETAALRLFADAHMARGQYADAIGFLSEAFDIVKEIGDSVVQASVHISLAEAYLAQANADAAVPHVSAAAMARPEDADSLKVQAGLASLQNKPDDAARLMGLARTNAGELWTEQDAAQLAAYRRVVNSTD